MLGTVVCMCCMLNVAAGRHALYRSVDSMTKPRTGQQHHTSLEVPYIITNHVDVTITIIVIINIINTSTVALYVMTHF